MDSRENKQLAMRGYELFKAGDIEGIVQLCTDDIEWNGIDSDDVPFGGRFTGKSGVADFFSKLHEAMEFERFAPETFTADGDRVAVSGVSKAIVRTTGLPLENRWMHVFTVKDGKILRFEQYDDSAAIIAAFTGAGAPVARPESVKHH